MRQRLPPPDLFTCTVDVIGGKTDHRCLVDGVKKGKKKVIWRSSGSFPR